MAPGQSLYSNSSPLPPIGTPARAPTVTTATTANLVDGGDGSDTATFCARYEAFQQVEQAKASFIEEIIQRYNILSQEYQHLAAARGPEQDLVRAWQCEKLELQNQVIAMKNAMHRDPIAVVLIDGDGMIFKDEYIRDGELGGRRAAAQLYKEIEPRVPPNCRIICRVYANVRGLADVLVRIGAVEELAVFEDFVRGFTRGRSLFDFVDVGAGKDRADSKIIEMLKVHLYNVHCRQIFFGCSHDNGFARILEEHMSDPIVLSRVTLLEGVPFEKELLALPYNTTKFPDLFRDAKINLFSPNGGNATPDGIKNYNILTGLPSRLPAPLRPSSHVGNAAILDSPALPKIIPVLPRTPSSSSLASDGLPAAIKPAMNWAAKAAAPPPPQTQSPKYEPPNREEVIARNRAGQRVDPQTRDYDKTEVDRVKKIKMCNVHFIRQECPYGNACTHLHNYKPTPSEISTLRLVARMAPCQNGSSCQDIKCIYGHRCPAPRSKSNPPKGTKSCIFGDNCKFPPELHDLDCNVVKTLVIR
ncbi:hypothetical protein CC80DRAFT_539999 [Byssothecium circinans]|uniref:C3H1-type domain-containing protein n=1 Tax=Byssothecium circinans TaxID=147558 RepID=A0A6A5TDM2_9PLEO|nr:hypothetical protein CC80DRAFT_539999 [Byssothecium circinans]